MCLMVEIRGAFSLNLFMQKVSPFKSLPVDLKALKDGLSSLLQSSQKVMFSEHKYEF